MATFFKRSDVWVVEFSHDGRPRTWYKALPQGTDAPSAMREFLQDVYGGHARLLSVRLASAEEERDYVRGDLPRNLLCPAFPRRGNP